MMALLLHEVKYYFKNKSELIYLYSYFISIIVLAPFTQNANSPAIQSLAGFILWIALASTVTLGSYSLFKRDFETGRLEYYQLLPYSLEAVVLVKWLGFLLFLWVPLLGALPIAALLFDMSAAQCLQYAIGLGLGSVALSMLASLVAAITNGLGKAGAILSLVMLPLAIPVLIVGAEYCRDNTALWQPHLLFLLGMAGFLLPVMCLVGAHSIRASH
jgi:heme exporter protein B